MPLLNEADLKRHNSAIAGGLKLIDIQSFIDTAINKHIIPLIGFAQLTELEQAKADPSPAQQRVIDLLQKAAVGFMVYYWADQGALEMNSTGIQVRKGPNVAPASDKKILALKKQNIAIGFDSLELATAVMEASAADFPIYLASSEREENTRLLMNSSAEFQAAGVHIDNDARLYRRLRTYQGEVEDKYVLQVLGDEIRDALHQAMLSGTMSEVQKKLLSHVRKAIAFYTMAECIPYMAVSIDSTGIFQLNETVGGISGNVENRSSASDKLLASAMHQFITKAEEKLEMVRKFLIRNKQEFSYTAPETVAINEPGSNVYFF